VRHCEKERKYPLSKYESPALTAELRAHSVLRAEIATDLKR
jgi:hypothetical protein